MRTKDEVTGVIVETDFFLKRIFTCSAIKGISEGQPEAESMSKEWENPYLREKDTASQEKSQHTGPSVIQPLAFVA